MYKEFIAFDFSKLKVNKFFENYIDLLIKNKKEHKFGIMILAYFYFIRIFQFKIPKEIAFIIMKRSNIKKFQKIFNLSTISHIYNKYKTNLIHTISNQ